MYKQDQLFFGSTVISMDVEDVKTTFYDTLRMAGDLEISSRHLVLWTQLETDVIHRFGKDKWRQIPVKIMIRKRISWVCITSLIFTRRKSTSIY